MIRVVYIAGYGRSGSTLLDIVLTAHEDIFGLGEVAGLPEEIALEDRRCACGSKYRACTFWGDFAAEIEDPDDLHQTLLKVEARSRLPALLLNVGSSQLRHRYAAHNNMLFRYAARRSGANILVDSSKNGRRTAGRFLALERLASVEVYVLHLVRRGSASVRSYVEHGSNWALEGRRRPPTVPGIRASVGWTLANSVVAALRRCLPQERYRRVWYSDLVESPRSSLSDIGEWLGLEMDEVIAMVEGGEPLAIGHQVGGNRLRKQDRVRVRTSELSGVQLRHRITFGLVGGWLEHLMRSGSGAGE